MKQLAISISIVGALLLPANVAWAQCCGRLPPTIFQQMCGADVIIIGRWENSQFAGTVGEFGSYSTELRILQVVKGDTGGAPNVVPFTFVFPMQNPGGRNRSLVTFHKIGKKLEFSNSIDFVEDDTAKYILDLLPLADQVPAKRLPLFLTPLAGKDQSFVDDAIRELKTIEYRHFREFAEAAPTQLILSILKQPKLSAQHEGALALLLAHGGNESHFDALKSKFVGRKEITSADEDLATALILLKPTEGWKIVSERMLEAKTEFLGRYAMFRVARFIKANRPELVDVNAMTTSLVELAKIVDMSDFAIDELRRWERWEHTKTTLELFEKSSHKIRMSRSAIMRFALASPDPLAVAFVAEQRRRDAGFVEEIEELLSLETQP